MASDVGRHRGRDRQQFEFPALGVDGSRR